MMKNCVIYDGNITIGNHTFAAINAQEKYDTLSSEMNEVMVSINNLIAEPKITISSITYSLDIILGSDYKVQVYNYTTHQNIYFNAHHGHSGLLSDVYTIICTLHSHVPTVFAHDAWTKSGPLNICLCMVPCSS